MDGPDMRAVNQRTDPVLLEVESLKTTFDSGQSSVPAVDGISFSIRRNETFALVGESGSGKTTIANLISRFYDPTVRSMPEAGSLLMDGRWFHLAVRLDNREQHKVRAQSSNFYLLFLLL